MALVTRIAAANVDITAQVMIVIAEFGDNASVPTRVRGSRVYTFRPVAGVLKVSDDTPGGGTSLPDAQVGLKNAVVGGGATNGLIPELNTYFSTNAASIVL